MLIIRTVQAANFTSANMSLPSKLCIRRMCGIWVSCTSIATPSACWCPRVANHLAPFSNIYVPAAVRVSEKRIISHASPGNSLRRTDKRSGVDSLAFVVSTCIVWEVEWWRVGETGEGERFDRSCPYSWDTFPLPLPFMNWACFFTSPPEASSIKVLPFSSPWFCNGIM